MGDTPSLMRLFHGTPADPNKPSWGGQYVRAWDRPHKIFTRITTEKDSIEQFGVLELLLSYSENVATPYATMNIDRSVQAQVQNDTVRFLFSPKNPTNYKYNITSNIPSINNLSGSITSYTPPASNILHPSSLYPYWWTDDPSPEFMEDGHIGIKTLNCWREDFLKDFAERMSRCTHLPNE
jgi:hypothetical protein